MGRKIEWGLTKIMWVFFFFFFYITRFGPYGCSCFRIKAAKNPQGREVAELRWSKQCILSLCPRTHFPSLPVWIPRLSPRLLQIMIDVKAAIKWYHSFSSFQKFNELRKTGTSPQSQNQSWRLWSLLQRHVDEFKGNAAVDKYWCCLYGDRWPLQWMDPCWQRQMWAKW